MMETSILFINQINQNKNVRNKINYENGERKEENDKYINKPSNFRSNFE